VNRSGRPRRLQLVAYLEWCCGTTPSPRREFNRIFVESWWDAPRRTVLATSHMWDVGNERYGHWNTSFPYVSAFAAVGKVADAEGDKAAFLGRGGSLRAPESLGRAAWQGEFGRHVDHVAAMRSDVALDAGGLFETGYVLATDSTREGAEALVDRFRSVDAMEGSLAAVRKGWAERLSGHRVEVPEKSLEFLLNDWLRYQAISARLWGRCGYYQQSGAYGFRDQLQDSQVWLTIDPPRTRAQAGLHAAHQFADGSVYHWWHPLTEQGHVTRMTDDLLWLAFVLAAWVKETGDLSILGDRAPYLDEKEPAPLSDHVLRAFRRVFARTSARGIPFIGAGDWNDGLSAAGLLEKGESVWLGHFLAGLLADWSEIFRRTGEAALSGELAARRTALVAALNEHGWDGAWYSRGTLDDGSVLGGASSDRGRIFLNAQTWAILNDVAPPDRARACLAAVKEHLVSKAGALLLSPAYDKPVPEIGYITRYAPGLRENGGVYTHAATWAISAAAKAKDPALVSELLRAINPALKEPDAYWAEPYVLPGNVDGPDSPHHGRAGWTWYTGSAQWLHRVVCEWVLGVRPVWDGLGIDPCLPPDWDRAAMTRPFRGATYEVRIFRDPALPAGVDLEVALDGVVLGSSVVPPGKAGERHEVRVRVR
jgi:cellobiose phosphorylase